MNVGAAQNEAESAVHVPADFREDCDFFIFDTNNTRALRRQFVVEVFVAHIDDEFVRHVKPVAVIVNIKFFRIATVGSDCIAFEHVSSAFLHIQVQIADRNVDVKAEKPRDAVVVYPRLIAGKVVSHVVRAFRPQIEAPNGRRRFNPKDLQAVVGKLRHVP